MTGLSNKNLNNPDFVVIQRTIVSKVAVPAVAAQLGVDLFLSKVAVPAVAAQLGVDLFLSLKQVLIWSCHLLKIHMYI